MSGVSSGALEGRLCERWLTLAAQPTRLSALHSSVKRARRDRDCRASLGQLALLSWGACGGHAGLDEPVDAALEDDRPGRGWQVLWLKACRRGGQT